MGDDGNELVRAGPQQRTCARFFRQPPESGDRPVMPERVFPYAATFPEAQSILISGQSSA